MKTLALAIALLVGAAGSAAEPEVRYPYRVEGVCPFECCQLGRWTARSDIPVLAAERGRVAPAFTIRSGETFEAVRAAYWTLWPLVLRAKAPIELLRARGFEIEAADRAKIAGVWGSDEFAALPAGTELHVLANLGEGAYAGVAAGKAFEFEALWKDPAAPFTVVKSQAANATEWWIEVDANGRRGWFERGRYSIEGSDACE